MNFAALSFHALSVSAVLAPGVSERSFRGTLPGHCRALGKKLLERSKGQPNVDGQQGCHVEQDPNLTSFKRHAP